MVVKTMKEIEDFEKRGEINSKYDLWSNNIIDIINNSSDQFSVVTNAFIFGYMKGRKATQAEMKEKECGMI